MRSFIKSFTDLKAWQESHKLAVKIYATTKEFSVSDRFGLVSQMERAAISVSSNLAEGFGRESLKDARHFYVIARGSLVELQNQLLLAKDTNKITDEKFKVLAKQTVLVHKLINGILRTLKNNQQLITSNKLTNKKD